jgi:hypothetical protein
MLNSAKDNQSREHTRKVGSRLTGAYVSVRNNRLHEAIVDANMYSGMSIVTLHPGANLLFHCPVALQQLQAGCSATVAPCYSTTCHATRLADN